MYNVCVLRFDTVMTQGTGTFMQIRVLLFFLNVDIFSFKTLLKVNLCTRFSTDL